MKSIPVTDPLLSVPKILKELASERGNNPLFAEESIKRKNMVELCVNFHVPSKKQVLVF